MSIQIFHARIRSCARSGLFFLSAGSLFTLGAGPNNSTVIEASNTTTSSSAATSSRSTTIPTVATAKTNPPPVKSKCECCHTVRKCRRFFKLAAKQEARRMTSTHMLSLLQRFAVHLYHLTPRAYHTLTASYFLLCRFPLYIRSRPEQLNSS